MKKLFFLISIVITLPLHASWNSFGPDGIAANKIRFVVDNQSHWVICHDEGIYVYDLVSQTWTNHATTLPVLDACYLDGTKILVIMGEGTFSDGIYSFDPASGVFEVIEWVLFPHFILYHDATTQFYVGHYGGLTTSPDGYNWTAVNTFQNKNMVAMAAYENHFALSEMDNLLGVWFSDDAGITWSAPVTGSPMISDMGFHNNGILYGIFPDSSFSSGLWSSPDFGEKL